MFEKTEIRPTKHKCLVKLILANNEQVEGYVFLARGERLADLLNDQRAFLPVQHDDDSVAVVAKSSITSAHALEEAPITSADPYAILRVEPTASNEEVRAAWMRRLKASHPDRLASLNLDQEIVRAARRVSQQINAAYDAISRQRRDANKTAKAS